jgi:predicted amidohydrolase YtcJ
MKFSKYILSTFLFLTALQGISQKKQVDLIVHNAKLYTVDNKFTVASSMAVANGKIVEVGNGRSMLNKYSAKNTLDAGGKFIYPGFIDAHAHFYRYGLGLQTAELRDTKSWAEVISILKKFAQENPEGWITGRGWDQNDWEVKEFPDKVQLDIQFPDRPVLITRVDGHAAMANQKALDLGGVRAGMEITGGQFETKNGKLTGLLIDNAIGMVRSKIPAPTTMQKKEALLDAQRNCFAQGLTTVDDCGLDYSEVLLIDSLQKTGELKMRMYVMLSDGKANYDFLFKRGKIKTDFLNVRSFKVYADGALGSRGASLMEDYSDQPGWKGFLLSRPSHFDSVAAKLSASDFQMCTHAIGDSGNREILRIYGKYLKGKNDKRWRIEHAQVIHEKDFSAFGRFSIIPSVQPTHATSDMYWAGERLGPQREKGAYAFQQLLNQNGWIPLGTDFPVEDISPFKTFLAAVFRVDAAGWPKGGYQKENALTRQQALRGMTIWAARSNFEEKEKGSLEKGKWADFIMLDQDLMTIPAEKVLSTRVVATFIAGKAVHEN